MRRDQAQPRPHQQDVPFQSQPEETAAGDFEDSERERVDIPAFLRRQAN